MRVRRAGLLWLLAWCGPLLLVVFVALAAYGRPSLHPFDSHDFENTYPNLVFGSTLPVLGALVLTRLPRHRIGWVFLVCGLASALTMALYPYASLGMERGWPLALAGAWVSEWIWGLGLIPLVTIGVLLFPDGNPPGRRWRLLLAGDLLAVALVFLANAFHPGSLDNFPQTANPLGLPLPGAVFGVLRGIGMALFLVGFLGGVGAALWRWRRATGVERSQLSWFAFATAVVAAALLLPTTGGLRAVVIVVAVPLLPVAVAVAVLRRHLYGVEVVVRRSLVYGVVTSVLLVGYAATATALGAVLGERAGATATLAATALVAVAFAPVRLRAQRAVDRLLYGDRDDPYAVLTGLGRRLERPDAGALPLAEVAVTVAASLKLPYVRVEVCGPDGSTLAAETGAPVDDVVEVPLVFRGEPVGRMLAAPRTPHDPFRPADLRLLDDLGRQVGVAAHAVRLAREVQQSRTELVTMREEERRRIRRDLHDGLGPALAGVALGLDAVSRTATTDPEHAAALAHQLKQEVHASLADVRRLVEELRPPALDQLGLVGAVRAHAVRLTERDPGLEVAVVAQDLPHLSAAVEVAAYRIATEALTNVSRHAAARHCRVGLSLNGDAVLVLEVEDDGLGLPAAPTHGVGLTAMHERAAELGGTCRAGPAAYGGTRVEARLPVASR